MSLALLLAGGAVDLGGLCAEWMRCAPVQAAHCAGPEIAPPDCASDCCALSDSARRQVPGELRADATSQTVRPGLFVVPPMALLASASSRAWPSGTVRPTSSPVPLYLRQLSLLI